MSSSEFVPAGFGGGGGGGGAPPPPSATGMVLLDDSGDLASPTLYLYTPADPLDLDLVYAELLVLSNYSPTLSSSQYHQLNGISGSTDYEYSNLENDSTSLSGINGTSSIIARLDNSVIVANTEVTGWMRLVYNAVADRVMWYQAQFADNAQGFSMGGGKFDIAGETITSIQTRPSSGNMGTNARVLTYGLLK